MFVKSLKRILFIGGVVSIDLLLEIVLKSAPGKLSILVGVLFLTVVFFVGRKILSEYQTAGIIFSILAVIVAYSTFLHKTNLYFTFWFNVLFGLLIVSILSCLLVLKPKFNLRYISFLILHISILTVAAGFLVNAFGMKKCYFPLEKGKTVHECFKMENTEVTDKRVKFPYPVNLEDFKVDFYRSEPVLGVFFKSGNKYKLIKTFPLERNKKFFGLGFKELKSSALKLTVLWGEGKEGEAPVGKVFLAQEGAWAFSSGDESPGIIVISSEKTREFYVPIKGQPILVERNMVVIPEDFYPNFKYDINEKKAFSAGSQLKNPALKLRILTPSGERKAYIFAERGKPLQIGNYEIAFSMDTRDLSLIVPDRTYINEEFFYFIKGVFEADGQEVTLLPEGKPYFRGKFAYRLLTVPPQEKDYTSVIKVGNTEFTIKVNHPYKFRGYVFYQSNYNPSNLNFSGVMIVKEPGEFLLYIGFVLMAAGALLTVVNRRKIWS